MKKNMVLLLLITGTTASFAQKQPSALQKIYATLGTGPVHKNGYAVEVGLQAVWKNNWTTALYAQMGEADPKNLPEDYKQGYTFIFPDPWPAVELNMISITGGRNMAMGRRFWLTAEGGVSFVSSEKMTFQRQSLSGNLLYTPSNYATTTEDGSAVGGVIRANLHWAFLRFAGLGLGGFAHFNSLQSASGLVLKLIIGKMNIKPANP
ncbi:MAG TPA: hypothetical protein VGN63_14070 [Flavisolibacter sp.]|nr:hypothetical protein [Flavisolibacter sp.]